MCLDQQDRQPALGAMRRMRREHADFLVVEPAAGSSRSKSFGRLASARASSTA